MKNLYLRIVGLLYSVLLLSACFAHKTPQEVADIFWESVISNDVQDVVKYSTLTSASGYDGFSQDWSGYQLSWGRVVIDGDEASIVSELAKLDSSGADNRKFVTYLIRQDEEWKVDYVRTGEDLRGGLFANLFGQLDQLGKNISDQFRTSSKGFSAEMERMSEEFEGLSHEIGEQASESIKRYGEDLRRSIDELAESARRALKEQEENLSDRDRRVLNEVVVNLNQDSENLSRPSVQSISEGSKNLGKAQQQLESVDDEVVGKYKEEWHEWGEKVEADLRKILDELSASAEGQV